MTAYAYKWVSLQLAGVFDWRALERAMKKGWEPVPLAEMPEPVPNPLDFTAEQMSRFKLHRKPLEEWQRDKDELEFLNEALIDTRVHRRLAEQNLGVPLNVASYGSHQFTDPVDGERFARKVEVARKWLAERGLL